MGYPRHLQVLSDAAGIYHCVSRCVRRAFLCGDDALTGRSFAHRRDWLETSIHELAGVFAVAVHAYAVMSNHFHLVIEIDPTAPSRWSDDEVARRWLKLSRRRPEGQVSLESRVSALTGDAERLEVLRHRLGSLSWFMRYLKEPIARRANKEDQCTGRFWEGRFKSQALLDDPAVLSCMVYVDLNPVRAGVASLARHASHTSLHRRVQLHPQHGDLLTPVASSIRSTLSAVSAGQYLELVDWTSYELHASVSENHCAPPATLLNQLAMRPQHWLLQVPAIESRYHSAIGRVDSLIECARRAGRQWIRGVGTARLQERAPPSA